MRSVRIGVAAAAIAFGFVGGGTGSAWAQVQPAQSTPPVTTPPTGPISEQAKSHFNAGVSLLQDPEGEKVEEAYRQFRTAYDLSGSPKILGNMGFCAMRLERDGEAIDAYSRYLREVSDIDTDERAQIVRDLQTLTIGVTRIAFDVSPPGAIIVDERVPVRGAHVTNTYGPAQGKLELGIRPGHHVFTAKLAGYESASWEVEAYAGGKEQHTFALKEPPKALSPVPAAERRERPSAAGPIIVASAGGAMLVAAGITGIIALNKTSDIEEACPGDRCPRSFDLKDERSSARTFVGVTDLLLVVGAVAVVGGLVWGWRVASAEPKTGLVTPPVRSAKPTFLQDWRLSL